MPVWAKAGGDENKAVFLELAVVGPGSHGGRDIGRYN